MEGLTLFAVITRCVVLAVTHQLAVLVLRALAGMAVTFAPEEARQAGGHTHTHYNIL